MVGFERSAHRHRRHLPATACIFAAVALLQPAAARVLVLDPAAGPCYTFAECFSAARVGDEIEVAAGVYTEHLAPPFSLSFRSREGPEQTILDGESAHRLVWGLGPPPRGLGRPARASGGG